MADEIWTPIPGYEAYEVSNLGGVRRVSCVKRNTVPPGPIKPAIDRGGRLVFNASGKAGRRQFKLHRAVMLAFVGPCPPGHEVAHLNGIQTDCRLENLMYATPKENNSHKVAHGTQPRGENLYSAKLKEDDIRMIRRLVGTVSQSAIAEMLGVSPATIAAVVCRKTWRYVQ